MCCSKDQRSHLPQPRPSAAKFTFFFFFLRFLFKPANGYSNLLQEPGEVLEWSVPILTLVEFPHLSASKLDPKDCPVKGSHLYSERWAVLKAVGDIYWLFTLDQALFQMLYMHAIHLRTTLWEKWDTGMFSKLHEVWHVPEPENHPKLFGTRANILFNHILPKFLSLQWIKPFFQSKDPLPLPSLHHLCTHIIHQLLWISTLPSRPRPASSKPQHSLC